jgi:hypothetical protein
MHLAFFLGWSSSTTTLSELMFFSVVNLAKSIRETKSDQNDAIVYNYDQSLAGENFFLGWSSATTTLSEFNESDESKLLSSE